MCVITSTELRNNYGKYVELAQKEEIQVTKNNKVIFTLVPAKKSMKDELESFFGILPEGASIGEDPDERDPR